MSYQNTNDRDTDERNTRGGDSPDPTNDGMSIRTDVSDSVDGSTGLRSGETVVRAENIDVWYGDTQALSDITMEIPEQSVTAMVGPSGCGKSTFLRCINRMNDLIDAARVEGDLYLRGKNVYDDDVDPVALRRRVGMVFQEPNPFPKSIYDNVAYGLKIQDKPGDYDEIVEESLRRAALWDEVKDQLDESGLELSGGQQQRLCIARAIAPDPEVLLMDEPASALDPVATSQIEDLIEELAEDYTVIIVTHNMQQAARISDRTAVFLTGGELVEYDDTQKIFENPENQRVEDYITGKFG
jgi:phosphate transport system ATP-binding protein